MKRSSLRLTGRRLRVLGAGAFACLASVIGCTVGPNYQKPQSQLPSRFDAGPTTRPSEAEATGHHVDLARWWTSLEDAELNSLIVRGVRANPDLGIAVTRLQAAREVNYVLGGEAYPLLEFAGAAGKGSGNNETKGRISQPLNAGANTAGFKEITQAMGFDAVWEVDLFGRLRRLQEAAAADLQAAAEDRNDVLVTIVADISRAYVDLRSFQARVAITRQNVAVAQRTVQLVQTRLDRGLTNELDVVLAQRQLASIRAQLAPLEASAATAQRRIAVLLGVFPEDVYAELSPPAALSTALPPADPGLPFELVQRRPDIRRAERQLAASTARIGVATANLFPDILLTAGGGAQGQGLGRSPVEWKPMWSVGPAVRFPILDFGSLDALVQIQDFQTQALLLNYRRAILRAVQEVDDALGNYAAERDRLARLGEAVDASQTAVRVATERYDRGLTDFLNVLDAQRQLYTLQDQFAVAQEEVVTQFIALHKALGGGWQGFRPPPPPPPPQPAILAAGNRLAHHEMPPPPPGPTPTETTTVAP